MGIKYKNDGSAAKRDMKNKVVAQKTRQTLLEEPRVVPQANNLTCFSRPSNGMPSSSKLLPKITKKSMPSSKPNNGVVSFRGTTKSSSRLTNGIDSSSKNANGDAPPLKKVEPSLPRKEFSSVLKDDLNSSLGSLKNSSPSSIFGNSRTTLQNVNGEAQKESMDEHIQLDSRKRKSGLSENEGTDAEKFKSTRMEPMDCSTQHENRNISLVEDGRTIDDKLRKRTEALSQENPQTHEDDDSEEGENRRPTKRRRKLILNNYEDDDDGEQNLAGAEIDTAGLTTQTAVVKDSPIKVSKPSLLESLKLQQYGSLPIDEPVWSGLIKIGSKENVSLVAHLSTKCCEEVWKLAGSLQPEIRVTKLSRMEAWPKSFEALGPTDDNIALYFLPYKMRQHADLDLLVKEAVENDMVLQAVIGEAEMLIFPSILLPEQHQTFQGKPYLWAVFKRIRNKVATVEAQQHGKGRCTPDEMGKQQASHCSVGKEDHSNMDGGLEALEEVGMEREQNPSVARANAPSPATQAPTMHPTMSENNGQIHPSLPVPTGAYFGFVLQSNPRVEQLIQEMQREGAVMVAMRGEMIGSGLGQATAAGRKEDEMPPSSS